MKIAVLTSGGDAPGMNAAVRAVVRSALYEKMGAFAVYDGYKGLCENIIKPMKHSDVSSILDKGGTILGTSRMPDFNLKKVKQRAIDNLRSHGIDVLITIGGDGTFMGAKGLHDMGFPTIGIPASIDNDIDGTDFSIGFHTALKTVVENIDKIKDTSSSHQRASIVETMGRKKGDLALYAGLSTGAEFIITPENIIDKNLIIETLKKKKEEGRRNAIIVVTENILNVHEFANEITEKSGFTCRATVLGYVQRGGSPTPEDRILAARMGEYAVKLAANKTFGVKVLVNHDEISAKPFGHTSKRDNYDNLKDLFDLVPKIS